MGALPAKDLAVLLADVRELIVQSREGVARAVDAGLATLYWHLGQRIRQDILKEKRAEYGERIVSALRTQLEHVAQGPLSGPAALPAGRVFAAPPTGQIALGLAPHRMRFARTSRPCRLVRVAVEEPQGRRAGLALHFSKAPDREIVVAVIRQLGWTHFLRLIPINDPLKRDSLTYSSIIEDSVA